MENQAPGGDLGAQVLAVHPDLEVRTLAEFVKLARLRSSGTGFSPR